MQTLGDALTPEQRKQLDKPARRILNRGLGAVLRRKARELQKDEFRPEELLPLVRAQFPSADADTIGHTLAQLAKQNAGIERVGFGKTGIYRVAGTSPNLEDEAVLDKALEALQDLEALIKRHREVLVTIRQLKKALGA